MLNFASLFNQFRSSPNNGLSDLIDNPSTSMARLLDEDTFINQFKTGNSRAVEFVKYDKMEELIDYVTVVGPPDDKKRSYKYPQSTCQLLSADNSSIIEFFFPEKTLEVEERHFQEIQEEVEVQVDDEEIESQEELPKTQQKKKVAEVPVKTVVTDSLQVNVNEEQPKTDKKQEEVQVESEKKQEKEEVKEQDQKQGIKIVQEPKESQPPKEKNNSEQEEPQKKSTPQKKKKIILEKRVRQVQKVTKRQVQPLITKLMSYFDGQVNYTLAGYVSKILTTFFNKKPVEFMKFILEPANAQKFINHAESRSVGELIIKIVAHESVNFLPQRKQFFKQILKELSTSSQIHIMSNISSYACQIIQKISTNLKSPNKIPQLSLTFFTIDIITSIIKNIMSNDQNISIYNAPILHTYLINVPFGLPEEEVVIDEFKKLLEVFIEKSCDKLRVNARSRPKIGTGRVKIIQILRFIIKENIMHTRQIASKIDDFFPMIINLMKEYEMNNVLHNQISRIIQVALTDTQNSHLNKALFKNDFLVTFIRQEMVEDKKIKAGQSQSRHRKGYIAHIINFCLKMNELKDSNQTIRKIVEGQKFEELVQTFVEKEVHATRKSLAGYSMRRDLKHEVMFQREDVINNYMAFFQKCPASVYQTEQQHANIEHPDLVEELQKQLQENLNVNSEPVGDNLSTVTNSSGSQQNQPHIFFKHHMDYNLEDLMNDL